METLTLKNFIQAADDTELAKYKFLAILKKYAENLHKNKLYPTLADLIAIKNELEIIIEQINYFEPEFIINLNFIDFKESIYDKCDLNYSKKEFDIINHFIKWALPGIKKLIHEGKVMFNFIEQNIIMNEVGIMPICTNQGYFMIPDKKNKLLKIYRYEMSLFSTEDNPLRTLKSKLVDLINLNTREAKSKLYLKSMLIKKHPELPNPAIYSFETDLDFPFVETIMPVAKRKLVRALVRQ